MKSKRIFSLLMTFLLIAPVLGQLRAEDTDNTVSDLAATERPDTGDMNLDGFKEKGSQELDFYDDEDSSPDLKTILAEPSSLMETAPLHLTLEDCIRMSVDHNAKLQATGYDIDAAKASLKEVSMTGWPIFEYEYRNAPVPGDVSNSLNSFFGGDITWWNKFKIGAAIPITTFGKVAAAKDLARQGVYAAEVKSFQEKSQLVSRVKQLYFGVLFAEEMGRLLKKAYEHLKTEIDKREKAGENADDYSPIENLKIKVYLFELEKRLAEARQKETMALEGLRVQMGLSQETVFTVFSSKLRPVEADLKGINDYLNVAMENRPDAKLLRTAVEAKRNQYVLEKRKMLPDLSLGAYFELGRTATDVRGIAATDDFNNPFQFNRAGVGVSFGGKLDIHGSMARIKRARSEYYRVNLEQLTALEAIKLDVKDAYLRAKTAMSNVVRADKAQTTARQLLFFTQSNYQIGVGEQKDYVDALQLVLLTRGRYFESVFDLNTALAQLDEKVGVIPEVVK